MEKARQDLYKQIQIAYDYPENRENRQLSSYLLSASNQLIKNQNPIIIARELNTQIDNYILQYDSRLSQSLWDLKTALSAYISD
ncbi:bacteriocin immunity protein [Streptococcus uberis]|uniref:bacteriocin immunity protein n=1 Tax=Streptococcus uberis TaxID=1349 RepID=UPI001C93743C|nr:bacteriocin immunity protein [Streptococcus uberis]MBY4765443.1 bacteriocin immunity protein [Streptococcus uberis]